MHHDLVEKKRWISENRFLHALNYCMVLPGPEAQQLAVYIGWLMHRTWGGIIAGSLFFLPSFFILTGLAWIYMAYGTVPAVAGALYGIKPAVVAIVLFAAYRIGSRALKNNVLWFIAAMAFIAIFALKLAFPIIILSAGFIGYFGGRITPQHFKVGGGHGSAEINFGPALIDDDTPTPAHALFSWARMARVVVIGIAIWIVAMAGLVVQFGRDAAFTQMGWFFTKAALLTFGGAYAVLPYVYQGAVEHYHWLTPTQMIDGLALGETTPGPLIMVVTFVGFVGGWVSQVFGPDAIFASAFVAAVVVTFFTFLPSFIFIFMGGPFIETTHGNLKFTAPLSAITAAVVGVILNLALFFAYHVFWPLDLSGRIDWYSIALTAAASVAVFRFKLNVIPVILACGVLGMLFKVIV
jgi:chromate transporter